MQRPILLSRPWRPDPSRRLTDLQSSKLFVHRAFHAFEMPPATRYLLNSGFRSSHVESPGNKQCSLCVDLTANSLCCVHSTQRHSQPLKAFGMVIAVVNDSLRPRSPSRMLLRAGCVFTLYIYRNLFVTNLTAHLFDIILLSG